MVVTGRGEVRFCVLQPMSGMELMEMGGGESKDWLAAEMLPWHRVRIWPRSSFSKATLAIRVGISNKDIRRGLEPCAPNWRVVLW